MNTTSEISTQRNTESNSCIIANTGADMDRSYRNNDARIVKW